MSITVDVSAETGNIIDTPNHRRGGADLYPAAQNKTLFQAWEWNVPADQKHYQRLLGALDSFNNIGITTIWLPPACKAAAGSNGNGYDIYDLWDLGEFDQKGSVATKFGKRDELKQLADKAKDLGIGILFDAVLNHKAGADKTEKCKVIDVDDNGQPPPSLCRSGLKMNHRSHEGGRRAT